MIYNIENEIPPTDVRSWVHYASDFKSGVGGRVFMPKLIPLHGRFGEGKSALVDDDMYERFAKYRWRLPKRGYPSITIESFPCQMHRIVAGFHGLIRGPGQCYDHINGDGLDNRFENLRVCSHGQNQRNQGPQKRNPLGTKGVHKRTDSPNRPYMTQITVNHKKIYLGSYATLEEAARVYDAASIKYHGDFGRLNFPKERR